MIWRQLRSGKFTTTARRNHNGLAGDNIYSPYRCDNMPDHSRGDKVLEGKMSDSYSCELGLRKIADEMHSEAYRLEEVADLLLALREQENTMERIKKIQGLKQWALQWLSNK